MFGETLGLSTLFDSDFPVKAIPSHADLGLEGGNSHSCLSDSAVSSTGRAHAGAESKAQRGPRVLISGIISRPEAGVPVAGLKLHPTFPQLGTAALRAIYYPHLKAPQPNKEKHLSVASGPSAPTPHLPKFVLKGPVSGSTAKWTEVEPPK